MGKVAQADGRGSKGKKSKHTHLKKQKRRVERKRAKLKPDCQPAYGKYSGYET